MASCFFFLSIVLKFFSVLGDLSKSLGYKNPPLTTFRLNNLITQMHYDTNEVEKIVKKLPYNLEQGTKITFEWLKV